jgi:hypothetical protein
MRKGLLWTLGISVLTTPSLFAQTLGPPIPLQETSAVPKSPVAPLTYQEPAAPTAYSTESSPAASGVFTNGYQGQTYRVWGSTEYMLWWVKNAPLPIPLVTAGNPNDNNPGAIGQPGTRILLGDSSAGFGTFSGMRVTLGAWLDSGATIGIEGSGFVLERRSSNFFATSNNAGSPLLAFPFFNQTPTFVGEDALRISDPRAIIGQLGGSVLVSSSLQLWGTEVNSAFCLWRTRNLEFTMLAGFKYAQLQESLHITNATGDLLTDPTVTILNDSFDTRNQFYGGQIGGRLSLARDRFSLDVTGTVALGTTHEVVDIQGSTVQTGPLSATPGHFPGGFFTEASNIGHYTKNQFTVLPALEMKVNYQVTPRCSVFAGYDVLYWNQVVRPGNQIDRNINLNQNTPLGFGGVPGGPNAPAPLFNRTDFWAQGVTFGFEFRY